MIIKQLSLFLENKPGHLARACQILANAGLNVESMALADTEQFGILRFLIRDWEKARQVLTDAGAMPRVTDVLAIAVPNRPGGLVTLLSALDGSTVNIEYMYGFNSPKLAQSVIVLRLDDPQQGILRFQEANVRILTENELFD